MRTIVREFRHQMAEREPEIAVEDEAFFSFLRCAKSSRILQEGNTNAGYA
jgi:hypothetical protein